MIMVNKLFSLLTYGASIPDDSTYYKKRSTVVPSIRALELRNKLFRDIDEESYPKAACLVCQLMPATYAWLDILDNDPHNTYEIYCKGDLSEIASSLYVDDAFVTSIKGKDSVYGLPWIDKLGVVALAILKG